ncbi:hypothetical protein D0T53_03435 [Dysgonomonas sp. 216]|uniref:hypothetical protein n=1 Tax=Dysgonomonas sp. 216 TaxID=2302934 RepID=UPI0013D45753|nr:hypothetical protein [Dysgonomonas sp. 216]NDW17969.1 hypothetical protein [Dysgonomonas sp. 216]
MMKTIVLIFLFISISYSTVYCQSVSFPSNISISKRNEFLSNETKIENLPIYFDNVHALPEGKNPQLIGVEYYGFNLQNKVPMISTDDFRYGHKFENPWISGDATGFLSVLYWLPSNGNYTLLYCILESGRDDYRCFLITTTTSGLYIDHKLVHDGWDNINFTQAELSSDLTLKITEIRMNGPSYISRGEFSTFNGQKANLVYKITPEGKFVLQSENIGIMKTYNVESLESLLSPLP